MSGPNLAEGMWFQKQFQKWDGDGENKWEVVIPGKIKGGRYIVRHEIVSLHVAGRPQFYVECAHLDVRRGDGVGRDGEGVLPPEEYWVTFPGAYEEDGEFSLGCSLEKIDGRGKEAACGKGTRERRC